MIVKNNIKNLNKDLDATFGKNGTQTRIIANANAKKMYFGALIELARKKSKISIATLSKKTQIPINNLKSFESGDETNISFENFLIILEILGLKMEIFREI